MKLAVLFTFILSSAWAKPLREIAIIITDNGHFPSSFVAYTGERVRVFVTNTTDNPECVMLENHELFLSAEKNQLSEQEIDVSVAGRYKIYCPSSKWTSYMTVIDRSEVEGTVGGRSVASQFDSDDEDDLKPSYWLPREE